MPRTTPRHEKCHSCKGEMKVTIGPGRFRDYRGVQCEVPHDLAIDECTLCGNHWVGHEEIEVLSEAFEKRRLEHASHPGSVEIVLRVTTNGGHTLEVSDRRDVTLWDQEDAHVWQYLNNATGVKSYNQLLLSMLLEGHCSGTGRMQGLFKSLADKLAKLETGVVEHGK